MTSVTSETSETSALNVDAFPSLPIINAESWGVTGLCVTPDSSYVLKGLDDGTLGMWDLKTGVSVCVFNATRRIVTSVCVTSDGKHVVAGSADHTARVWQLEEVEQEDGSPVIRSVLLHTLNWHRDWVNSVCVTKSGKYVVTGSSDHTACVWRMCNGMRECSLVEHSDWVTSVCVTADDDHVVTGSMDKTVCIWRLDGGALVHRFETHGAVMAVCVTSDGYYLVTGSLVNAVQVWDVHSDYELFCSIDGPDGWSGIYSVCVTPDNKHVVAGSTDQKMWTLDGGEVRTIRSGGPVCVCVTPDGNHLVADNGSGITKWPLAKARLAQLRQLFWAQRFLWWWWSCVWKPGPRHANAAASEFAQMQGGSVVAEEAASAEAAGRA
tara:strand:- start:970 stop:2109 length:1140 start_codon:yes stop_codon:yes gene_type:complete